MSTRALRPRGIALQLRPRIGDGGEGIEQHERLIEHAATIRINDACHAAIALAVKPEQRPMFIGQASAGVFVERAVDSWDVPAGSEVLVGVVTSWVVSDGDGDAEFFPSSSSRYIRRKQAR